jgi:hypothetical protein
MNVELRPLMSVDQQRFLTVMGQLPPRLTADQAACMLNCQAHDIPALVAAKLLKPIGKPPANGIKYFATPDLLEKIKDRNWVVRVTITICQHWQKRNAGNRNRKAESATPEPALAA